MLDKGAVMKKHVKWRHFSQQLTTTGSGVQRVNVKIQKSIEKRNVKVQVNFYAQEWAAYKAARSQKATEERTEANTDHFVSISSVGNATEMEFQTVDHSVGPSMDEETKGEEPKDDLYVEDAMVGTDDPLDINPELETTSDNGDTLVTCWSNLCRSHMIN